MDKQKYLDYIQQNFSGCKNCGSTNLAGSGGEMYGVVELDFSKSDTRPEIKLDKVMPLLSVVCNQCGYVHFFAKPVIDTKD